MKRLQEDESALRARYCSAALSADVVFGAVVVSPSISWRYPHAGAFPTAPYAVVSRDPRHLTPSVASLPLFLPPSLFVCVYMSVCLPPFLTARPPPPCAPPEHACPITCRLPRSINPRKVCGVPRTLRLRQDNFLRLRCGGRHDRG